MNSKRLAVWVGAAVGAMALSTAAVAVATLTGGDGTVLSQQDVASQLASEQASGDRSGLGDDPTPEPSETATTPAAPPPSDAGAPAQSLPLLVASRAGTLAVRCAGNQITLERWAPNAGYRADDVIKSATRVSVWFESDVNDDVEVIVTCSAGNPVLKENVEVDDHGGGGGGGGRG